MQVWGVLAPWPIYGLIDMFVSRSLSMTFTSIFCLTNHPLVVVHSLSPAGAKSKRRTSWGKSFVISRSEMFLPMHVLEPAPNCIPHQRYFDTFGTGRTYCQVILIQERESLFLNQPTLRSKIVHIFAPDIFITMDHPCIYAHHSLSASLELVANLERTWRIVNAWYLHLVESVCQQSVRHHQEPLYSESGRLPHAISRLP